MMVSHFSTLTIGLTACFLLNGSSTKAQNNISAKQPNMSARLIQADDITINTLALNERLVQFCREHLGKQVGSGQCAALVSVGLEKIGAHPRFSDAPSEGDYVWGKFLCQLEIRKDKAVLEISEAGKSEENSRKADVRPGDIIQFRNAEFHGRSHQRRLHHTAVVAQVSTDGKACKVYEQNISGRQYVIETTLCLSELTRGWLRVYRPMKSSQNEDRLQQKTDKNNPRSETANKISSKLFLSVLLAVQPCGQAQNKPRDPDVPPQGTIHRAVYDGNLLLVKKMLQKKPKLLENYWEYSMEAQEYEGTPLCVAAYQGNMKMVKFLIERGAKINPANKDDFTPLHCAAVSNKIEVAKFLIEKGANVNTPDHTPLMVCAEFDSFAIAKLLLEKGAKINAASKEGETATEFAIEFRKIRVAKFLIEKGGTVKPRQRDGKTPFMYFLTGGGTDDDIEFYTFLLDRLSKTIDINTKDKEGKTALDYAHYYKYEKIITLLIERGAKE